MSPAAGTRVQVPALPTGSTRLQLPVPLVAFWRCVDRNPPPVEQGEPFSASLAHGHRAQLWGHQQSHGGGRRDAAASARSFPRAALARNPTTSFFLCH